MKKLIVTAAAMVACVSAFAQGKIVFGNDAAHLVALTVDTTQLPAAWNSLAGLAVPQIGGANAQNMGLLSIELLAGPIGGALTSYLTVGGSGTGLPDGRWTGANFTFPAGTIAAGPAQFRLRVFETSAGSYANAAGGLNLLYGETAVFTANTGGFAPNPIYSHLASGANSTWADAPITMIANVPEPSTFALAGLGAAAMMIMRRRK